jgi:hypothetical protein
MSQTMKRCYPTVSQRKELLDAIADDVRRVSIAVIIFAVIYSIWLALQ